MISFQQKIRFCWFSFIFLHSVGVLQLVQKISGKRVANYSVTNVAMLQVLQMLQMLQKLQMLHCTPGTIWIFRRPDPDHMREQRKALENERSKQGGFLLT